MDLIFYTVHVVKKSIGWM